MKPFLRQPILRLSSLLPYDWASLHRTVCRELADFPGAASASFFPAQEEVAYRETGVPDENSILYQLQISGLENTGVSRKYLEYYKQVRVSDEQIALVSPKNGRYRNMYKIPGAERNSAIAHFPETYKFIKSLPFKYIGRAIIWLGLPNCGIAEHYDLSEWDNPVSNGKGHFLLFDFPQKKEFWVRDRNSEKEYANDPVIFFDSSKKHGSDVVPYRNYLMRVDGIFTDDFQAKVDALAIGQLQAFQS